jgi:membrane protein required for colicin V production
MSFYDILMMTILGLTILFGLWKGLAWQIASLAAIIVSYIVAMQFRGEVSGYIQAEEPWNRFAAMLILYVGTSIVVWIIYCFLVRKTIDGLKLRWFDRPAGAMAGAAKGAILCMVITIFSVALLGEGARDAIMSSKSGGYITAAINRLDQWMPPEIHAYVDPYVNTFNHKMTEKDPNWIRTSQDKLDSTLGKIKGNLKTFHGNWNQPSDSSASGTGGAANHWGPAPQPTPPGTTPPNDSEVPQYGQPVSAGR